MRGRRKHGGKNRGRRAREGRREKRTETEETTKRNEKRERETSLRVRLSSSQVLFAFDDLMTSWYSAGSGWSLSYGGWGGHQRGGLVRIASSDKEEQLMQLLCNIVPERAWRMLEKLRERRERNEGEGT